MQNAFPLEKGACAAALALMLSGTACGPDGALTRRPPPDPIAEDAEVVLPDEAGAVLPSDPSSLQRLAEETHVNITSLSARKWGLPVSRVNVLGSAADDPDAYEAGVANGYNQQWSHAYLYTSWGFWIWGDANENFDDCITGRLAGQIEGPECKDGQSAKQWYSAGDQSMGDAFLGYATHSIEDASMVLHASFPSADMLTQHFAYETWVKTNWTAGHRLALAVDADNYYYPISDLQQAVRNTAWAAAYGNSSSAGRKAWEAYRAAGYPTAAGTGNADLVSNTKVMLIRASRYTLGAIKYTLDTYGQWTSRY